MKKRAPVDLLLSELEDLLRERIELLYAINPTGFYELYDNSLVLELEGLLSSLSTFDTEHDSLAENTKSISKNKENLAKAIDDYNNFITAKPHTTLMAKILGLQSIKKELYI